MKKEGLGWESKESTNKLLSIHLDISELRNNPSDPIYRYLVKMGRKISFPTVEFLQAWDGDLSFRQGGATIVKEEYIKSEMDEEFNMVEVKRTKDVLVPGFSLLFSVNEYEKQLISRLFAKGILRKEQDYYRVLTSPRLNMQKKRNYLMLYSGERPPKVSDNPSNHGVWTERGTKVGFVLDSLSTHEVFGTIHIPVDRLIRRSKFF